MKYIFCLFFIFFSNLGPATKHEDNIIFYLNNNDFENFSENLKTIDSPKQLNLGKHSLLRLASRKKKLAFIDEILKHPNYPVSRGELISLAKNLLKIQKLKLKKKTNLAEHSADLGEVEKIFSTALDLEKIINKYFNTIKEDSIAKKICYIASFLCSKDEIARWLERRNLQNQFSVEDFAILNNNLENIFFDPNITQKDLRSLIEYLYDIIPNNRLAIFIVNYANFLNQHTSNELIKISEHKDKKLRENLKTNQDPLMLAIYAIDIDLFSNLGADKLYDTENHPGLNRLMLWRDQLANLLIFFILWPADEIALVKNYERLAKIMEKLKKKNDYFGAAIIAQVLNNHYIERALDKTVWRKIKKPNFSFIDPGLHHKIYKEIEDNLHIEGLFFLPMLEPIIDGVTRAKEATWLQVNEGQPSISPHLIEMFSKLKTKLNHVVKQANLVRIDSPLKYMLSNSPNIISDDLVKSLSFCIKPLRTNIHQETPINLWDFGHISEFIQTCGLDPKKIPSILNFILTNLNIKDGLDLIKAYKNNAYVNCFRLDLNAGDSFFRLDNQALEFFFEKFGEYYEYESKDMNILPVEPKLKPKDDIQEIKQEQNFFLAKKASSFFELKDFYEKIALQYRSPSRCHSQAYASPRAQSPQSSRDYKNQEEKLRLRGRSYSLRFPPSKLNRPKSEKHIEQLENLHE